VSGFLLDTNVILLAGFHSASLPENTKNAIEQGPNYLSVVSYWEVVLKSMKGRLNVGDPLSWWSEALRQMAATPLLLRPEHLAELCRLPPIHQDPFDRALIAQARIEDCTLLTTDRQISLYADRQLKVSR
jgi:PIN domain nuclease of toxin-antitoxin system